MADATIHACSLAASERPHVRWQDEAGSGVHARACVCSHTQVLMILQVVTFEVLDGMGVTLAYESQGIPISVCLIKCQVCFSVLHVQRIS